MLILVFFNNWNEQKNIQCVVKILLKIKFLKILITFKFQKKENKNRIDNISKKFLKKLTYLQIRIFLYFVFCFNST